jgi:trk system potassium uptake protein TrkH
MTIACSVFYKYFGMSWFDAVCHAFSTISIGGFSTHDESFSFFKESSLRWTAVVFMLIAGINFALHYIAWTKKRLLHYLYDTEVKFYLSIILVVFSLTSIALYRSGIYVDQNTNILEESAFQVVSIATTTALG